MNPQLEKLTEFEKANEAKKRAAEIDGEQSNKKKKHNDDETDKNDGDEEINDDEKEVDKLNEDKPDDNMDNNKNDETDKDESDEDVNDGDNEETDEDESDKDMNDGDNDKTDNNEKDKDKPDETMTSGQKNLMVTYRPNGIVMFPQRLQYKYTYKTSNDGKRNDSQQNHAEFASFVVRDLCVQTNTFVDVPEVITIDQTSYQLEQELKIKSKNNELPNHFSHDELLYSKNAKAINTRFSHHATEITKRIKELEKEKNNSRNRDKRCQIELEATALMDKQKCYKSPFEPISS
jgi:hypothetical protein